jgi:hypothetical protein
VSDGNVGTFYVCGASSRALSDCAYDRIPFIASHLSRSILEIRLDNLAMPAEVIAKGKLSDLQLEAVVYGCMRHLEDMPVGVGQQKKKKGSIEEDYEDDALGGEDMKDFIEKEADDDDDDDNEPMEPETPRRAGFLLGDGAGMGKGRTLAGFVLENVCRGRNKHIWISVSSDLYEDAKRDLIDIGLKRFAEDRSLLLGKANYGDLEEQFYSDERTRGKVEGGMLFSTYSTLISKTGRGKNDGGAQVKTRLDQVVDWCGGEEFDGLLMFDEVSMPDFWSAGKPQFVVSPVLLFPILTSIHFLFFSSPSCLLGISQCHKAKNVTLDADGNAKMKGEGDPRNRNRTSQACSKTAAAVVELQRRLPRARVVYCSATSVSDPSNLGFMNRLGLWGPGTEHPQGFNQFLKAIKGLGTGAMELHALHLKAKGAMLARTLSYKSCEFQLVTDIMQDNVNELYDKAAELWHDLYIALTNDLPKRQERVEMADQLDRAMGAGGRLDRDLERFRAVNADSDDEGEEITEAEKAAAEYRRTCREREPKMIKTLYWVSPLFCLIIACILPFVPCLQTHPNPSNNRLQNLFFRCIHRELTSVSSELSVLP